MSTAMTFPIDRCRELLAELPKQCAVDGCRSRPTTGVGGIAVCKHHISTVGFAFEALERETVALSQHRRR